VVNDLGVEVESGPDGAGRSEPTDRRDASVAGAVVDEVRARGGEAIANGSDVSTFAGGKELIDSAIAEYGRVDSLINNAGTLTTMMLGELDEAKLVKELTVHIVGYLGTVEAVWPHMVEQGGGTIVNTSSGFGGSGPGLTAYMAAKSGVFSITRDIALEGAPHGIRCNSLTPAARTRMSIPYWGADQTEDWDPNWASTLALFFASSLSDGITGASALPRARQPHPRDIRRRERAEQRPELDSADTRIANPRACCTKSRRLAGLRKPPPTESRIVEECLALTGRRPSASTTQAPVSAPARPLSALADDPPQRIITSRSRCSRRVATTSCRCATSSQTADLALATVYRYFPSKELLLAHVFEQWCEGYWTRLARAADGRANIDRLIDLASRSVEAYESHSNILVMISTLQLSNDPSVSAVMEDIRGRAERFFLAALEGLDPTDAAGIVDVVFAVMGAKLAEWVRGGDLHRRSAPRDGDHDSAPSRIPRPHNDWSHRMRAGFAFLALNYEDWADRYETNDFSRPAATPDSVTWERILRLADLAEPLGFDSIWAPEHHTTPYCQTPNPLTVISYMAGRTKRVDFGTMVVVLPWHHPFQIAGELALVDNLLQGRNLYVGMGRGLSAREFGAFAVDQSEARERYVRSGRDHQTRS
jgi:NAD(P)-dependent dehydrogenase (short-subunit alcohol dehydrogenase family)/AcrR family transcriptional regulator